MLEVLEMVVKESMGMAIRSIEPVEMRRTAQDFIPPRLSTSSLFSVAPSLLRAGASKNRSVFFVLRNYGFLNSDLSPWPRPIHNVEVLLLKLSALH